MEARGRQTIVCTSVQDDLWYRELSHNDRSGDACGFALHSVRIKITARTVHEVSIEIHHR